MAFSDAYSGWGCCVDSAAVAVDRSALFINYVGIMADMHGSAEMDGLTEGDWDIEMRREALVDGITDDWIDSEGEEVGANLGQQSSPSNPHLYELYGR